jgi:class 3 adenylate cyclase
MAQVQLWLGFAVTALLAVLQSLGLTRRLEYPLYDLRMLVFNVFSPPPSDQVVVIAIDDPSIETVGKWPWPRGHLGLAIAELERAGAAVVALDLLQDDPQAILYEPEGASLRAVDNDALLAAAMKSFGGVVQGASFPWREPREWEAEQQRRAARKVPQVRFDQILGAMSVNPYIAAEELRETYLPGEAADGPHTDDIRWKMERARTLLAVEPRSSLALPRETANWPASNDQKPPVPAIAAAAASIASVSFGGGDADGAVRRIPLWVQSRGRIFPSLGLAAALKKLGVPLSGVAVDTNFSDIGLPGGERLSIPTHAGPLKEYAGMGELDGFMHVVWPRGGWAGWERQFARRAPDSPKGFETTEIPLGRVLDPVLRIFPVMRANIAGLSDQVRALDRGYGLGDAKSFAARTAEMDSLSPDAPRWRDLWRAHKSELEKIRVDAQSMLADFTAGGVTPEGFSAGEKAAYADLQAAAVDAPRAVESIDRDLSELDAWRGELARRVGGRVCFIGWTATGALADFVRTSIDSRTPGVMVHAAIANTILNSVHSPQFLQGAPHWMNLAALLALGILGTMIGVRLGVVEGPFALIGVLAVWFTVDGLIFWDWRNLFVAEVTPMAAAVLGWLGVILHRLLIEQRSRRQTEARFRSYVSPDVVDILVNNPGMDSMRPQKRELTIFFSDIAGWTTIAERLGTEGVATFLATYLKAMTDILQDHRATIDKYLGDGIMAFWGAPIADDQHAAHAVDAVLLMQKKLEEMNEEGAFGPAGRIGVRIGLASGEVNVGDFGNPPDKSAYTVIGDAANLSARLEAANKQFGSRILMTERTRALAGLEKNARLIGKIVVKGKTEPETLWEPVGEMQTKGPRTAEWISLSNDAVRAYMAGDFNRAEGLFARLEAEFGERELAGIYRSAIEGFRRTGGPPAGFDGTIVLTEK